MKRNVLITLVVVIILLVIVAILHKNSKKDTLKIPEKVASPLDATFVVDGENVNLKDGKAEESVAPGSAVKVETSVFGKPIYGDIGDGPGTAVMFLSQEGGGTGVFVYAVAARKIGNEYRGTNSVFLGDRISPQNIRINNGAAEVNFVERKADEPMSAEPTVGVTKYLVIKNGVLTEK